MQAQHPLAKALAPLHLLNHPFYQAWMEGRITHMQLQDYAGQYSKHVDAFPRYLSALHSLCEDQAARKILLENLNDEEGLTFGTSHPDLWAQFAEGLGVSKEQLADTKPRAAIQNVMDTFFKFSRSSPHEGLGALYAYEHQVPEVAASKIEGLKTQYNITDKKTLEFFEVHKVADIYHRAALEKIIDALPEAQKAEALAAAKVAAQALWDFLSDVYGDTACMAAA